MKDIVLEFKNISKRYDKIKALKDVSFSIPQNSIFGILGANGSGKSTFMKILPGLIYNWSGKIFYLNKLYYLAIDTLLTALEFGKEDKIYILIAEIYKNIGNAELSKMILDLNIRNSTINSLKNELSGIFRKDKNQN